MNMRDKFIEIYKKYILRAGSEELLDFLINSDFFTAPASSKYHLAVPGGLCQHSVNVYEQLRDQFLHYIEKRYGFTTLTPEQEQTIAICGLLHDICKVNYYTPVKKSRKTGKTLPNGKPEWEDYMGYDVEDKLPYGHGEKSVYIISGFMRLTLEEAMAIRWHMGFSDNDFKVGGKNVGNAFAAYHLAVLTHVADLMATYMDEGEDGVKQQV